MKPEQWRAGLVAALCLGMAGVVHAAGSPLKITDAWVRWLPGDLPSAGYTTIANTSANPIALLGADSPDYAMVMLHRSLESNGVERMEHVDRLEIPAHGSVALAPGGYHLMLTRPTHPVAPGNTVHLHLHFSGSAGTLDVPFIVRPASAQGSS